MADELLESRETVHFDESSLLNLSYAAARLRRLQLLDADTDVVVVDGELQRRPRQMEQVKEGQVKNDAGGFVFSVSDETAVRRFLIIGSDNGTYYQSAEKLTASAAQRKLLNHGKERFPG